MSVIEDLETAVEVLSPALRCRLSRRALVVFFGDVLDVPALRSGPRRPLPRRLRRAAAQLLERILELLQQLRDVFRVMCVVRQVEELAVGGERGGCLGFGQVLDTFRCEPLGVCRRRRERKREQQGEGGGDRS